MARLLHLFSVALMALLLLNSSNMSEQASTFLQTLSRAARSTNDSTNEPAEEKCLYNSICGWAIYKPFTKNIDYYMPNSCKCPEPSQCIRTEESDVTINAYRYRCKS